jgi:mRNA interferase MazF
MPLKRSSAPPGWFPRRGEVCLFVLDKERPALIVSSNALNRHALDVCVVPLSTVEHRAFSLRPKLRAGDGGLERDSWAKCDQVTTIAKTRAVYPPLGALSRATLERIQQAIKQALELP